MESLENKWSFESLRSIVLRVWSWTRCSGAGSKCLESLRSTRVGVWSHSGASVWSHSGAGVGMFGVTPEQVFGVIPELECLESLRSWSRCLESLRRTSDLTHSGADIWSHSGVSNLE